MSKEIDEINRMHNPDRFNSKSHEQDVELERIRTEALEAAKLSPCLIAQDFTTGDRAKAYGHPFPLYSLVAKRWETIFGVPITTEQVIIAMLDVKISRELMRPNPDNPNDIAGYANVYWMVREERTLKNEVKDEIMIGTPEGPKPDA
ncbi:MAG TPA: hypothetical protein ENI23_17710 [bacterium]|nr:hypothetical protein [bacterium]